MNKVCVIGGGPAGMIAAATAASQGHDVTLYEKNEKLGKKMYITGKGRCNITNAGEIDDFMNNIVTNREFMYSSLYSFNNKSIISLLNGLGIDTKIERGNRIFPISNKSSDVIRGLTKYLEREKVKIELNSKIEKLEKKNIFSIYVNNSVKKFDKVIIATGGRSYPVTGSTGDGYVFAEKLGHTIIPIKPALSAINLYNLDPDLQGLALKNVELKLYKDNKLEKNIFGEMLFTHFGISGPIVLSMSSYMNKLLDNYLSLTIDLKPALNHYELDKRLLRDFEENKNKILGNSLDKLLPKKIINSVIKKSEVDYNKPINQISKEERSRIINILKDYPLYFKGLRDIDEAIITSGGIKTDEINSSTLESKIVKNLFFAGEIIDVDALTGGYNLQIAYSTGFLSGISI